MAKLSFSTARTGQRPDQGGGRNSFLESLDFKIGETKRLVIPTHNNSLVLFGVPVHPANGLNKIKLSRKNGTKYGVSNIRCTHPYSQQSSKEQLALAKKGEMCVFCELARYEERKRAETIREEFGDTFGQLTKDEQKAFYQKYEKENPTTVEKSYFVQTDGENRYNQTQLQMYMLVLELNLDSSSKPIKDENGVVKYTPKLFSVSMARINKFHTAVANGLASGQVTEQMLHSVIENEGTEFEERVDVGWIDFLVNFPQAQTKMASGKDMSVTPITEAMTTVNQGLIDSFNKESEAIYKKAENVIKIFFKNLAPHTRQQAIEMISREGVDGAEYFNTMREQFRIKEPITLEDGTLIPTDDDSETNVFENVLEREDEILAEINETSETEETSKEETSKEETSKVEETTEKPKKTLAEMTEDEKREFIASLPKEKRDELLRKSREKQENAQEDTDVFEI